jgi:hypothetical protein
MSKESLSMRKAAAYCDIPPSTFGGYCRTGRGPRHVRLHGICQFTVPNLDEWLRCRTVEGAQ